MWLVLIVDPSNHTVCRHSDQTPTITNKTTNVCHPLPLGKTDNDSSQEGVSLIKVPLLFFRIPNDGPFQVFVATKGGGRLLWQDGEHMPAVV